MAVKLFSYLKDKKRGDYYQVKDPDATRNIGDLTALITTAKNNLVAAINEIAAHGGGGGTSDYADLSNKPSINGVTLSGNKSASDLSLGTYSKPSGGIPKSDLASSVQTSLGKADSALQSAPVSSVDGKTGAVTILPSGGSTGQVLSKASGTDYDVEWTAPSGGGGSAAYEKIVDFTTTEEVSSVSVTFDATVRQKILDAEEILMVDYFVPTTDSSKTSKGKLTQRISTSATYGVYLRPDYNSGSIVPAYGQSNNMPRIVHYQKAGPLNWYPNRGNSQPYIRHVGYSNNNNPGITTSQSWMWEESTAAYRDTIDRFVVETDTLFGVGSNFRLYVR